MEMDRRSRSIDSPRRHRGRRDHRRYSRSRSRSRNRSREHERRRRTRSPRSRSRERYVRRSPEQDLYRELIYEDYHQDDRPMHHGGGGIGRIDRIDINDARYMEERFQEEQRYHEEQKEKEFRGHRNGDDMDRYLEERARGRDYDRERDRGGDRDRRDHRHRHAKRYHSSERDDNSDGYDGDGMCHDYDFHNQSPNNTIIVRGLAQHITEADITSDLMQCGVWAVSIRLIRKRKTGASRGFAFVEFSTVEEAVRWMDMKQGILILQDHHRAVIHYSYSKEPLSKDKTLSDWYCAKCGVFNFKRRDKCFKCRASREESEKGGEGSDEVSNILTKKIMLRNLDVLTNEEGVLTVMQDVVPDLVSKISKILVCRDPLTQTSRGICYLKFDNLVDSMNTHNALNGLEPPLNIDGREVLISYCVDFENRQMSRNAANIKSSNESMSNVSNSNQNTYQYTVADVPRLAEYSASLYASTPAEQENYLKYYTQYYMTEISKGQYANLPTVNQLGESANSGAAVALSAIQRKQNKMKNIETTATQAAAAAALAAAATKAAIAAATVVPPKGNDGKQYPTPDISLYQYDDTSGYYYDPTTGLYYDAHSQYYYNNETGAYLYWDQRKSTYTLATAAAAQAAVQNTLEDTAAATASISKVDADETRKESRRDKPDKVKVAKKIVKDMEKWAKQLNQKKDMSYVAVPQPILPQKSEEVITKPLGGGYADVGFSILEKKERTKLVEYVSPSISKLVPSYASDSDEHEDNLPHPQQPQQSQAECEKDYVDFQKLTCLLCKRAFQSLDILSKHLKMSNLHKENLQKYNMSRGVSDSDGQLSSQSYRDRAKERRLKYGESDPPPPNRSKERFENELKHMTTSSKPRNTPAMPIGENNVGNRLLQKMGWSEGQGLGRKNQGRTNIIEADARSSTAGLGTKSVTFAPGDDYKTYIKRMMKSRYEQAEIK